MQLEAKKLKLNQHNLPLPLLDKEGKFFLLPFTRGGWVGFEPGLKKHAFDSFTRYSTHSCVNLLDLPAENLLILKG